MNFFDRMKSLAKRRLLSPPAFYNPLAQSMSIAPRMDVDRVFRIFAMAEGGSTEELFNLYRDMLVADSHSQSEFLKRKLAVIGRQASIIPFDEKNPDDTAAADFVERQISGCSDWLQANGHLLDSALYPVSVAEKVFATDGNGYRLSAIAKVDHQALDFSDGKLKIRNVTDQGYFDSGSFVPDRDRYIVHRGNLLGAPDHFGGPMRSIVFWWLLSMMDRGWWAQFLERFGAPFLVGRYESGDTPSKRVLEQAFNLATKIGGLVVSRETEIEIKQAISGDAGNGYERFLAICQREKSKAIIGQTLSAEAAPTGLGSGVANAHEDVRDDIRVFDSTMLASTLQSQLFAQILSINGISGRTPTISFGGEEHDTGGISTLLSSIPQSGLRITDEGIPIISKRLGIPLERGTVQPGLPVFTHSASSNPFDGFDTVAVSASADLARAFRGDLAPVARIVVESKSADECLRRLRAFTADIPLSQSAAIIEKAMTAYSANGLSAG